MTNEFVLVKITVQYQCVLLFEMPLNINSLFTLTICNYICFLETLVL